MWFAQMHHYRSLYTVYNTQTHQNLILWSLHPFHRVYGLKCGNLFCHMHQTVLWTYITWASFRIHFCSNVFVWVWHWGGSISKPDKKKLKCSKNKTLYTTRAHSLFICIFPINDATDRDDTNCSAFSLLN